MGKIVCFKNQKGGVGKTSAAHNAAYFLARSGKKTLIVDIDPSRNSTMVFGEVYDPETSTYKPFYETHIGDVLLEKNMNPRDAIIQARLNGNETIEKLYLLASSRDLAFVEMQLASKVRRETILINQLNKIRDEYDYIIIDCPSYLGFYAILAIYAADFFTVLIRYESDALSGIEDLFVFIEEVKEGQEYDYKILRNSYNATKTTMNAYIDSELKEFINANAVFKSIIRQDEELVKAKAANLPIFLYSPNSKGSEDYQLFTKELEEALHG